jgi:hypothetical protein
MLGNYLRFEARNLASVWLLIRGKRDGVGTAAPVPYAGADKSMIFVFLGVFVVETALLWLLDFGLVIDLVLLVLGLYSALLVFGLHASAVTRPHVISPTEVRIRAGARLDVRIPRDNVVRLRHRREAHPPGQTKTFQDNALLCFNGAYETNLVVELASPITVTTMFGNHHTVDVIKCHADDPRAAVRAYEQQAAEGR